MKINQKHLWKVLLVVLVLVVLFYPDTAYANIFDKLESKMKEVWDSAVAAGEKILTKMAARIMGIDIEDNCVAPPMPHTSCLFCGLFKILFNAGSFVASRSYALFASSLGRLIVVFFAVSLAIIILKNIVSIGAKEPGPLINDVLHKTFVCVSILIIITQDYYHILNLTLTPVISTALSFIQLGTSTAGDCSVAAGAGGYSGSAGAQTSGAGLPASMGAMVICAVDTIEAKINVLFDYASWGWCRGTGPDRVVFYIFPNIIYLIDGIFLYIGGIFFMIAYPWVLGDAVLQLGIALALVPFAIAGYAFGPTRGYLSKIFSWILHSLFTFLFMAILLSCVLEYIGDILVKSSSASGQVDPKVFFMDPVRGIAFYGANMLIIIFVIWAAYTYMPMTSDLAETFAQGSQLSAAKALGDKVISKVNDMTEKGVEKAGQGAVAATKYTASVGKRVGGHIGRGAARLTVNTFGKTNAEGGKTLKLGKRTAFLTLGLVRNFQVSTVKGENGGTAIRRSYKSITGRTHETVSDGYSTMTTTYARDGRVVQNNTRFKHNFMKKHLVKKDGTVNIGALQTVLSSPMGQNPQYRQMLMDQVARDLIKARTGREIGRYYHGKSVQFDPSDPTRIMVEQVDMTGNTTKYALKIDFNTGQTAIDYLKDSGATRFSTKKTRNYERIFMNSAVTISTRGKCNADGTAFGEEITRIKYSDAVSAKHDSVISDFEDNQVVREDGTTSSLVDGRNGHPDLTFGMDNMLGATSVGGRSMKEFMVNNVLAEARRRRTTKLRTRLGPLFLNNGHSIDEERDDDSHDERDDNNDDERDDDNNDERDDNNDDERDDDNNDEREDDRDNNDNNQNSEDEQDPFADINPTFDLDTELRTMQDQIDRALNEELGRIDAMESDFIQERLNEGTDEATARSLWEQERSRLTQEARINSQTDYDARRHELEQQNNTEQQNSQNPNTPDNR